MCLSPVPFPPSSPRSSRTLAVGDTIQHKIAGHELRCLRWAQSAATAVSRAAAKGAGDGKDKDKDKDKVVQLCTPLATVADVRGFRFFIMW